MIRIWLPFYRGRARLRTADVMQPEAEEDPAPDLKSAEDYELAFHGVLLDAQKEATDFINRYLIFCYGIVGVAFLYATGNISKLNFAGADINLSKGYVLEYTAGLSDLAYSLIFFHIFRLARILTEIGKSSARLTALNGNAKVINLENMHLIVSGLSGVILASARQQTRLVLLDLKALQFGRLMSRLVAFLASRSLASATGFMWAVGWWSVRSQGQFNWIVFRILLVLLLIDSPVIWSVYLIYWSKYVVVFDQVPAGFYKGLLYCFDNVSVADDIVLVASVAVVVASLYSTFILAVSYARDLVQAFLDELHVSLGEFEALLFSANPQVAAEAKAALSRFLQIMD